jgi:heat shock protein HslJ
LYISEAPQLGLTFGCGAVGGAAQVGVGTLRTTHIPDGPAVGCTGDLGDQSTTVDSFFASNPVGWSIRDGQLLIYGGGAQAFSLVFETGGSVQPTGAPLVGTKWTLAGITDPAGHDVPVAGNASLLVGADDKVSGSDGCNSISGDVDVTGSTLGFGSGLATTEMACLDDQVTTTADHVDNMLSGDVTWKISGDELTLTKDGAGSLVYRATAAPTRSTDPSDLTGVTWYLTTIENGSGPDGVAHTPTGRQTLRVDNDITGEAGCNGFTGKATVGDGSLDVGSLGVTEVACADSAEVQAVLTGKVSWEIVGDQLTITKDGVGALVYSRSDPTAGSTQLTGTKWTFSSIEVTTANSASGEGSTDSGITLTLDGNGGFQLGTKCIGAAGSVTLGTADAVFSNLHNTGGDACLSTLEERVKKFLDGTVQWSITAGRLILTKGDTKLTFDS